MEVSTGVAAASHGVRGPFGGKVIPGPCPQPGTHYNSRYVCLTHTPAHTPHLHPGPGKLLADPAHDLH